MALSSTIQSTLLRHHHEIEAALHTAIANVAIRTGTQETDPFYGQIQYHLGWVDANLVPTKNNMGKLLRPTLVLLAYETAGAGGRANAGQTGSAYLERALPAAVAVEFTHNFTLVHDDIEDGDVERRHRPTLWTIWGVPQAINTGDGIHSLARLVLWDVLNHGVDGHTAIHLADLLDRASLTLTEGQHLDINFEERLNISIPMYLDMIRRKTAALIACSTEMGACLGTANQEIIHHLRNFGEASGLAFQIRDDLLGIWATRSESGKTPASDIYRRKKSLPIIHALTHANDQDRQILMEIYQQSDPLSFNQVEAVLEIMEHAQTQAFCRQFLLEQCQQAYAALKKVPYLTNPLSRRAYHDLEIIVHFIEEAAH
jgi:geranylgeranyl diphosphate synthase, type I